MGVTILPGFLKTFVIVHFLIIIGKTKIKNVGNEAELIKVEVFDIIIS